MTQRNRVHDGARATERKFYLPAGSDPASLTDRLEGIWTTLFNHGVSTSTKL